MYVLVSPPLLYLCMYCLLDEGPALGHCLLAGQIVGILLQSLFHDKHLVVIFGGCWELTLEIRAYVDTGG